MSIRIRVRCPECGAEADLTAVDIELIVPTGVAGGPVYYRFVHYDDDYTHRAEALASPEVVRVLEAAGVPILNLDRTFNDDDITLFVDWLKTTEAPQAELIEEAGE